MKLETPPQPPRPKISSFRLFREHLRGDYAVNNRSLWSPGFQAMAVYRLGGYCPDIPTKLLRSPAWFFYRFMRLFIRNVYGIELDARTRIGRRLRIAHQHGIVIHAQAVIGDDCLIRQGVTIGAVGAGRDGAPVVGNRVKFGAGAITAGPVRIGDGAMIGPNAVVMTNVPAGRHRRLAPVRASWRRRRARPISRRCRARRTSRRRRRKADVAAPKPAGDMAKADPQETLR